MSVSLFAFFLSSFYVCIHLLHTFVVISWLSKIHYGVLASLWSEKDITPSKQSQSRLVKREE